LPVFLFLSRSLKHYAEQPGPHAGAAASLYSSLRAALLTNIRKQYEQSGYLWEQYDDRDGRGKGCRPFTGWTALVALIAAEIYE
jgi:mannosyl-oligosaccharide glucosidase